MQLIVVLAAASRLVNFTYQNNTFPDDSRGFPVIGLWGLWPLQ